VVESVVQSHAKIVIDSTEKKLIRILHVDDELDLLKVAKQCLEMQGPFHVDTAGSVEEAMTRLKEKEYDAVISDYQMPEKNGLEFLEMLRKNGNTVPFVMFTGKGREEVAVKAWSLGADHYVHKTGDPETVYCELAHCLLSAVEKHLAEAQTKETAQKLQTIYQNTVEGITYVDAEENIVFANKAFADIIGYEPDQLEGMNLHRIVDDENWAKIENETNRRRQGESSRYEAELRRRDGTVRNVLISGASLLDHDGRFVGTIGIILDITEQKKAGDSLRANEKKYHSLYSSMNEGVALHEVTYDGLGKPVDYIILDVNPAFESITGIKKEKAVGSKASELHETGKPPYLEIYAEVVASGKPTSFETYFPPMKKHFNISVFSPEKGKFATLFYDTTEHRQMEKQLNASEEKYRDLFENAMDIILTLDLKGSITAVNNSVSRFGYKKEDLIGKNIVDFVSKEYWPLVMKDFSKVTQGEPAKNETELAAPAGKILVEYNARAIVKENNVAGVQINIRDVTERQRAEETLRKSEAKYRSLVEQSTQGIVIAQGSIPHMVFVNSVMAKILGYTVEELTSLSPQQTSCLVHPDDRELFFGRYIERLEGRPAPPRYEVRGIRKDGTIVWLELSSARIEYDGQPAVQAIFTDITERKKTEQTLKESEEKYRDLVELASDGIVAVNVEGIITSVNRSFLTLVGYDSEEEIVGKPFTKLTTMQIEDIPKFQEMFKSLMKGESSAPSEFLYVWRDGTNRWAEVHPSLMIKDGHPVGVQAIMRDVTERKNAEMLTRESQQKFEQLFMGIPEAAVYVDPNEMVLNVNPRFTELFGYSFDEIKGKFLDDFLAPEDRKQEALMLAQKGREECLYHETVRKNKKGSLIPVALSSAPIVLQGQHAGDIVLYKDITERKKAEEQKDRLAHDLNERVKELTCLYDLSKIIAKHGNSIEEIMQDTVSLLPPAYQYPKIACARIVWEDHKYITGNFRETRWSQKTNIRMYGEIVGVVEVYYLEETSERDKELFLKEEKDLLDAVAERLGRVIERIRERTLQQNEERSTRESQRKFEGLFMHNPEAAVYLNLNFKIVDMNPRFCHLFGYSAEETKGRNINEVIVPEGMREEAEGLDKDARNGYASYDTVRKRKDGSLVSVSISAAPVTFENNLLGYVGIYKDITDLKRAQEESEESRKHFQMLFDLMADPVAVVDERGKILEVTQKAEEITGFKKEEFVGKNLLEVEMFGAKTKAAMIESLAKRMMGMRVEPYEVEVLKKNGGKLVYEINAARISYKGKPADLIVFRDILDRKNLEEKLRVVGSLTRHDVRNKLCAVTGNAYLLKRKLAGKPEALEQLAAMESAVRSVEAIFEFARTYEKLGVEQLVNMNVGKAVDEAASLFPDLKGIRIANECGGLTVLADSLLRQLFYNLIDDSLKYGEKLTQIRIRYEKSENQLKLVYEDDGVGIPQDAKPKLFREGYTAGKGSGYGLYLIKRMMDVYGWSIQETGTPSNGVCFTIVIPEKNQDGKENYQLH
jgi:PAS domain S-box-containing protein